MTGGALRAPPTLFESDDVEKLILAHTTRWLHDTLAAVLLAVGVDGDPLARVATPRFGPEDGWPVLLARFCERKMISLERRRGSIVRAHRDLVIALQVS